MANDHRREEDEGGFGSPYCWDRKPDESEETHIEREEDMDSLIDYYNK